MTKRFFILDGHHLAYRAFFAPFANLSTRCPECRGTGSLLSDHHDDPPDVAQCENCNGTGREPTKATYGFVKMFMKLVTKNKPDYLVMAVDDKRKNLWRRKLSPQYKANREGAPDGFLVQLHRIKEIVRLLGVPVIKCPGFEADDVIGTLVRRHVPEGVDCIIVSNDGDLEQLLTDHSVSMYDPQREVYTTHREVRAKGYRPSQVIDIKTIAGCSGDNIKGLVGVGPKTAIKMLKEHGPVAASLPSPTWFSKRVRKTWPRNLSALMDLNRKLATVCTDCNLNVDEDDLKFEGLNMAKARVLFRSLGFKRWS